MCMAGVGWVCLSIPYKLNCTHMEVDDRMMFHVQDILSHRSGPASMTWSLGDTDVFLCLLYYVKVSWKDFGLQKLIGSFVTQEWEDQYCHFMIIRTCTTGGQAHTVSSQHFMHWLDVIPLTTAVVTCSSEWKLSTILYLWSTTLTVQSWQKHDVDGWIIPGEVSQANNRPGDIWHTACCCV